MLDDRSSLRTRALTDIAWDDESREVVESAGPEGVLFSKLDTLYGAVLSSWQPVITADANDPRRGGVPAGHPTIEHFLGVPFESGNGERGVIGLANRPGGFDVADVERLVPIVNAAASVLAADALRCQRDASELALERQRRLDAATARLARRSLVDQEQLDSGAVNDALEDLGHLTDAQRTYIFEFDLDAETMSNTFEWCSPGTEPWKDNLQELPLSTFPWAQGQFRSRSLVNSRVSSLPAEARAERDILDAQGITAVLWIPLHDGPTTLGFLGLDQVGTLHDWGELEQRALEELGTVLSLEIARLRSLRALRVAESRLEAFADQLDAALVIHDLKFEQAFRSNPAFDRLLAQLDASEGTDITAIRKAVHPDALHLAEEAIGEFLRQLTVPGAGTPALDHTTRLRRADGSISWARFRSFALDEFVDGNRLVGSLIDDITDIRMLQEELANALNRVATASRTKSEFLSRVSHELRSPLQGTLGFIELLRFDPDTPERERFLDLAERSTHQLVELIDKLLEIGRIESGRLALQFHETDIERTARDTLAICEPTLREFHVHGDVRVSGDVVVKTDQRRLNQILTNLVTNAAKYNRVGGSVVLTVREQADDVVVDVTDTGRGLTPDEIERIFVPFERLDAARTKIPGSGIGLPLVKQLSAALGISVSVDSTPGAGSTFQLTIPKRSKDELRSGPFRVLCIDDSPEALEMIEYALAKLDGLDVHTATSIDRAFSDAVLRRPDLVLIDRHLPDGDGVDAIARFEALGDERRPVAVAVVTGDTQIETRERAIRAGAVAFFTKPVKLASLLEFVESRLLAS